MIKILLLLCLLSITPAWAGKLDIDYIKPSPAKTAAAAIMVPGGGYFYLAGATKSPSDAYDYKIQGVKYLGLTVLGIVGILNHSSQYRSEILVFSLVATVAIRFSDIFTSIDSSEKDRYTNSRLLLNYKE